MMEINYFKKNNLNKLYLNLQKELPYLNKMKLTI